MTPSVGGTRGKGSLGGGVIAGPGDVVSIDSPIGTGGILPVDGGAAVGWVGSVTDGALIGASTIVR